MINENCVVLKTDDFTVCNHYWQWIMVVGLGKAGLDTNKFFYFLTNDGNVMFITDFKTRFNSLKQFLMKSFQNCSGIHGIFIN